MTGRISGPLLIGASMTIAEFMLPPILGEFKARYPEVQAQLIVANSETIESRVAEHTLDIGLIEAPSHLPGPAHRGLLRGRTAGDVSPRHIRWRS